MFKILFRMSTIILLQLLSLNRNIFQDLSLSMTKFQPSVAYKSVAYKINTTTVHKMRIAEVGMRSE